MLLQARKKYYDIENELWQLALLPIKLRMFSFQPCIIVLEDILSKLIATVPGWFSGLFTNTPSP